MICQDKDLIKAIYKQTSQSFFPKANIVDENWALYRKIQVYFLAALDYLFQFGDNNPNAVSKKIENEYLDLEYCITALVVGALASQDKKMIARFTSIKPDGIVISI